MLVELSDRFSFVVAKDDWLAGLPGARLILIPVIAIQLRGDELAIPVVTHHGLNSAAEAPLYVVLGVLGVLCGLCCAAFAS